MNVKSIFITIILLLLFLFPNSGQAGSPSSISFSLSETDNLFSNDSKKAVSFYPFDLRNRESFLQFTTLDNGPEILSNLAHIQIFDVSNNCSENDFFDVYTPNDTHVYNMRDIQTNDGNPSGVVLPENAYGIVAITSFCTIGGNFVSCGGGIGNLRIIDGSGYEYRTNAVQHRNIINRNVINENMFYSFNFSNISGISLSDVIGITLSVISSDGFFPVVWSAQPVQNIFSPFDIDIYDNNETSFSCRDIVFSCVNEDNPLLEELLENSGINVASFEYGINEAIPHSKGSELLCPGNTISEGIVVLTPEIKPLTDDMFFTGFVGLNNGNGRGSMDSFWTFNYIEQGIPVD